MKITDNNIDLNKQSRLVYKLLNLLWHACINCKKRSSIFTNYK